MTPEVPEGILGRAAQWSELHRWEQSDLAKDLRRLGLTYREIREIIPVAKATLSNWCSSVEPSAAQAQAIRARTPTQKGVPKDTQWRRRAEIDDIRSEASNFAAARSNDPVFIAGVVPYWAEGSKWRNDFAIANTDPAALRLFIRWVRDYLDDNAEFRLSLHLHEGNDDESARVYWRRALELPTVLFTKTYIKPRGTGQRKNHLPAGVCRVRVLRASNHWNRTMAWIDYLREHMA